MQIMKGAARKMKQGCRGWRWQQLEVNFIEWWMQVSLRRQQSLERARGVWTAVLMERRAQAKALR